MLKVLLVVPNFKWADWDVNTLWHYFPYNLCLLASMIRDICDVKILDTNLNKSSYEELEDEIKYYKPDIVGITVLMDQYGKAGHTTAKIIKNVNKDIVTIFGGVYATINYDYIMEDENVDIVVVGEGEYTLRDIVSHFNGNGELPTKGICYRKEGIIINTGHSELIANLDEIRFPAYDLINLNDYIYLKDRKSIEAPSVYPLGRIITSRGCPVGCTFCQVKDIMGQKFRKRSPQKVLEEVKYLIDNYHIKSITFEDDNLITNRQRAIDIFEGLKKFNISWTAFAIAAFKLDKELLQIMKESGCVFVDIAIESASKRILKNIIRKPVDLDKVREIVLWAKELDIFISANFMIGFPTETWEEIRTTIKFAEELNLDYAKFFVVIPLRHTELWEMCEKNECFKEGFNQENIRWSTGQLESDEYSSNDLTILRAYEWDRINFSSEEKIEKIRKRMNVSCKELEQIRKDTRGNVIKIING